MRPLDLLVPKGMVVQDEPTSLKSTGPPAPEIERSPRSDTHPPFQ